MKQQNDFMHRTAKAGLLLPIVLAACSDEMNLFRSDDGANGLRFELQATIDQTSDTRADESGFADGDRFGLFVVNYSEGNPGQLTLSDNQVNNVAMTYSADANTWQSATDIYWRDPVTPADVYGYYPFFNGMSDINAYSFEVRADQSVAAEGEMCAYEASDFLWAKTPKAQPGKRVELTFSHVMAGVKVVLEQGSGFDGDAWTKLEKTVTVDNTLRSSEVDLSTGVVTPVGSYDRNVVMNPEGDGWRAVVVPQTVAAGKSTIGITIDGKPYVYSRNDGMNYTAGKLHTFTIKIDRKADTGDYTLTLIGEDITPWEADNSSHDFVENAYVTVECPKSGTLKDVLAANNIDYVTLKNLKITGFLTTEDFDFMREEMESLTAVNLKEVKIINVTYISWNGDGEPLELTEDDVLPSSSFNCKSTLRRIVLPDGVRKLGASSLAGLSLNSTVVIPESVTHILPSAFEGCRWGFSIIMPHKLEYLGEGAFYECKADIQLFFPNSLKYIGRIAFWGAENAHGTLSVPSSIEYIGWGALVLGDRVDGEIVIPSTMTEISDWAFNGINIKGGTRVVFHDGVTKIGLTSFGGVSFTQGFTLPKNLKELGEAAFESCHFVDELKLPESLQVISKEAFQYSDIRGELTIPSNVEIVSPRSFIGTRLEKVITGANVEIIGESAFAENRYLREVQIGQNVIRINDNAFGDCPGLQNVVCLASEPPKINGEAFRNFDRMHCRLEVPEESVDLYKVSDGWNEFQFISPYRELSVGIHEQKCLNKGFSRSTMVYSEGKWRVKSSPSWIHVSPTEADCKEEITITVDELAAGSGDREDKIVFELVGKDYTTDVNIIQYDYEYAEDNEIELQKAVVDGSPVNIFIVGDGFGADDIENGRYLRLMNETMEHFFSIEPYKAYRNHFNVSTSIAMSLDDQVATLQSPRLDRLNTYGVDLDIPVVKDYVEKVSRSISSGNMKDAMIIVISNVDAFAGEAYPDEDGCALACVSVSSNVYPYDQRGLIQHVAGGKAFAGLAEEYVSHNENIKGCTCPYCNGLPKFLEMKAKGFFENVSLSGKMNDAPWRDFIFHPKYSGYVDMWEGGYNHLLGVWKSESQSVMGSYIAYYNTISRFAIYKAIMRRAGLAYSMDDFIANDVIDIP
ncbi:MAG: leucine-rich repeat protein [Bacteroides sp.]|nr:leucine-rich repeat protein [Bacteroides sp.]